MLTRWSKDSGMVLSYQLQSDYTLFKPVSQIHTPNAKAAAAELSAIYASEGVLVTVNDHQIIVEAAPSATPDTTSTPSTSVVPATPAPADAKASAVAGAKS